MTRLFLKMYLWFCAATALALLGATTATWLAVGKNRQANRNDEAVVHHTLQELTVAIRARGERALDSAAASAKEHVFLFGPDGRQAFGPPAPAAVKRLALNATSSGRLEETFVDTRFAAQPADAPERRYVLVVGKLSSEEEMGNGILALRLLALFAVMALCSYWFAKYITAPVSQLREAAQRFSAGHLDTRIGDAFTRRRDALADLTRNFDEMAGRVESLVTSQRRLLNDVSHELRSPLARLTIAVGLARRVAGPGAEQHLNRIEGEVDQLNHLIGQLLALARFETTVEPGTRVRFDLTALLQEVATDGQFEARSRGCDVRLEANGTCIITGQPELLRSALENVIRNAIRYTAPSTTVEIVLDCGMSGCASVSVRDRGPGIPESALQHIFEPFYRAERDPDSPYQGTGLGLAITQRAAVIHGGNVGASNRADGGLVVTLQFPTAPDSGKTSDL
jgi:signal transduction histidine kinase